MEIFLLGAGKPSAGVHPSALKKITIDTSALDWQIRSFNSVEGDVRFLGGYHAEDVIHKYPQLKYTVIPDWDKQTVLHTLLEAPLPTSDILVSYADTIFRSNTIESVCNTPGDIVIGVDSAWKGRFQNREQVDLVSAETILLEDYKSGSGEVEFTGLVYFKKMLLN